MCESLFADGLGSGLGEKVAGYAIKALAVAGGFLVGYGLGRGVAWALDRWVFAHKAPDQLKRAVAIVSGVALAVIVALVVFGEGGGGFFGGGGGGEGKGTPTPDGKEKQQPAPVTPKEEPKVVLPKVEPKPPDPKPTPGDVRIAILGGTDVRDGKFYVIDEETTPKTLDEVKKWIADRRTNPKNEPVLVLRFAKERLSDSHPEMKKLDAWLKESKLLSRFE